MDLSSKLNPERLPAHIAIIMDGNGRWAEKQGKERSYGHMHGVEPIRMASELAAELGIRYLTLYAFSTENWGRPQEEVMALMELLVDTINNELPTLNKNNIRLNSIGDISQLPDNCREKLLETMKKTENNDRLTLTLALSYSARDEINRAVKNIISDTKDNKITTDDVNEAFVSAYLDTKNIPDPDIVIRTGGEQRVSNFLLWQLAYSELYFTDIFWPDFNKEEFYKALLFYQARERRFGKTSSQIKK